MDSPKTAQQLRSDKVGTLTTDVQARNIGGRPPILFRCEACKAIMPSSKVTGHKC